MTINWDRTPAEIDEAFGGWTKVTAIEALKEGESLTTGMCEVLGIGMDSFLRFAQLEDETRKAVQKDLVRRMELIVLTEELGHCSQ